MVDDQWRACHGRAAALLAVGDKPGLVVEIANEVWDSPRRAACYGMSFTERSCGSPIFARGPKAGYAIVRGMT
jgi:hypothetical protein